MCAVCSMDFFCIWKPTMEFVLVTAHDYSSHETLKDMTILSIPGAFLIYTACKDAAEFAKGIVHLLFAFDCSTVLLQQKYCTVSGSIIFRHPTSLRSAVMFMVAEKILLDSGQIYPAGLWADILHQQDPQHRVARGRRGL